MEITLRQLQLLELGIAKEIKRICDDNGIEYFLVGGTLLGAVRHRGFIPWDDDMDIGMTTENYQKFISIAPEVLGNKFFLQNCASESQCAYPFSKVRLRKTHMKEVVTQNINMEDGVFVDIFPYDLSSKRCAMSRRYMRKLQILSKMKMMKANYDLNALASSGIHKLINNVLRYVPLSNRFVTSLLDRQIKGLNKEKNGEYYVERDGMFRGNFVFPKDYFDILIDINFEDTMFKAPKEYEKYLTKAYGNYMEFPPEAERRVGHSVLTIGLDEPIEYYFTGE